MQVYSSKVAQLNKTLFRKTKGIGTSAVAVLLILVVGCSSSNPSAGTDAEALSATAENQKSELTSMLTEFMDEPGVVNAMIAVNSGKSQSTFSIARGLADPGNNVEMTDQHQFHIASMTKPFTAILLLQLIEEGNFTLDSTLSDVLGSLTIAELIPGHVFTAENPEGVAISSMTIDELQRYQGVAHGGNITIRMLMQHSHGMPDLTFDAPSDSISLAEYSILKPVGAIAAHPEFPEQWSGPYLLEYYLASGLPSQSLFLPGTGYHYGDTGPVIAGLIIERVTGMSLAQAYRTRIFDRLGMNDTYLHHYEEAQRSESYGLSHRHFDLSGLSEDIGNVDVDAGQWNTSIDWAGGGLVSTAADIDRFYRGLFDAKLLDDHSVLADAKYWVDSNDESPWYGLGFGISSEDNGQTVRSYEHGGFWGSHMAYYPETQTSVVLTVNQVEFDQFDTLQSKLLELF